ncbi:hypothetical protein CEXT_626051 [Caerostris extrusa]|uniref:Uncharacterized protein n=1 Tax=Caerostris extrusa TaxID=172846 RepID=A0AAV4XZL0_CAEEX|nr:hypothetical protein CEXT_626051 [Caerostris extrusa]
MSSRAAVFSLFGGNWRCSDRFPPLKLVELFHQQQQQLGQRAWICTICRLPASISCCYGNDPEVAERGRKMLLLSAEYDYM